MDIQLLPRELELFYKFSADVPVEYDFEAVQCLTKHHLLKIHHIEGERYWWLWSDEGERFNEHRQQIMKQVRENEAKEQREKRDLSRREWAIALVSVVLGAVLTILGQLLVGVFQ